MLQKFRKIFNKTPDTPKKKKKKNRKRRPIKCAVLTSPKDLAYLKRSRPKYADAQNKKEKSIRKRQQSPQKRQLESEHSPNENRPLQWRNLSHRRMKMWITAWSACTIYSQIDQKQLTWVQKVPKTVPFEVRQHATKLFHLPKLRIRCGC